MKIPKPIKILLLIALLVALLIVGLFIHYGWTAEQRLSNSMTPAHRQALAYAARAIGLSPKDHDASIAEWRLAIKEEPDSREWQEGLAFELWQAKRIPEAVPIWKKLAEGNDDISRRSAKWLTKPSVIDASKQ